MPTTSNVRGESLAPSPSAGDKPPAPSAASLIGRRRSVTRRLLMSYAAVLVAFTVTVGWGLVTQRRAARDSELMRTGYVPLMLSIAAVLENQNLVSAQLNHITEAKNPADTQRWIEASRRVRPRLFAEVRLAADRGVAPHHDDAARALAARVVADSFEIEAHVTQDGGEFNAMVDALLAGRLDQAEQHRASLLAREAEGARRLRDVKGRLDLAMDGMMASARARERLALESLLVLACLSMVVGIAMTLHARRVLRPLAAVTDRAIAVSRGDMTPRPVVAASDEIGELAATFEGMVAAIAKANDEKLQSERLAVVGRMAAHVTHEIRNPLSSISLNLELLEEELALLDGAQESRAMVQTMRKEVDHLGALSQEYLSLARPPQPRLEPESLADIVREVTDFMGRELSRNMVQLELAIATDGEVMVDEGQIRQVLKNLVRNGREAMPRGGELRIGLREVEGGVELTVDDTGTGVPEDARAHVFEAFFTTKNRGTGLGLAVTRQIVMAHGGTIRCEVAPGGGARFRVWLPLAKGGPSPSAEALT